VSCFSIHGILSVWFCTTLVTALHWIHAYTLKFPFNVPLVEGTLYTKKEKLYNEKHYTLHKDSTVLKFKWYTLFKHYKRRFYTEARHDTELIFEIWYLQLSCIAEG
jgi:hypothetical protein